MRKLSKLFAGAGSVLAAAALVAGTVTTASAAPNDPPAHVVPRAIDITAVGSDTTTPLLDQISVNYNATLKVRSAPRFYSWDAVPPGSTSSKPTTIRPKAGCPILTRPNGSTAGWTALAENTLDGRTGHFCFDFSRSSGARNPKAPKAGPGGLLWIAFAKDAITWSTRSAAHGGSNAPASLTKAQLIGIFTCKTTNWNQVHGRNGKIQVFLPQPGSGTLATWEKFMGITTVGSCVSQAPEENEGTYHGFNSPNAVFIYSIGDWVAQKYHSANCNVKPTRNQNLFGCNVTGFLGLNRISGVSPTAIPRGSRVPAINPLFPSAFFRVVYNVVRWTKATRDHIPAYLEPLLAATGFLCRSPIARQDIRNYGFINSGSCGSTS